jgi:sulfotransferase family protein
VRLVIEALQRFARRAFERALKRARQRMAPRAPTTSALFVVGAQHSGIERLMKVLEAHPDAWVYHEYDRAAFKSDWHLRPRAVQQRLVARARCRWVAFKPIFDIQHLDRLLVEHPGSRAVYVVRNYRDSALSIAERWGDTLRDVLRRLATEDPCSHWLADRMPPARKAMIKELYHPGIDAVSAAALRWWLRNAVFFDLGLERRADRVLLLRYEDLVRNPAAGFARLFAFLGLRPDDAAVAGVSDRSIGRARYLRLEPRVSTLCQELQDRFESVIAAPEAPRAT